MIFTEQYHHYYLRSLFSLFQVFARGDRQILEKPIPQIIENGEVRVIVEKEIRNWQICEIVT